MLLFKGVSMNPFRIEILHGRKRENFVKAMIYCNHFKVERMLSYCFEIFVLLKRRQNAEKVYVVKSWYVIRWKALKKRKNSIEGIFDGFELVPVIDSSTAYIS